MPDTPLIRPYRASDRAAVRRLCCETGFLGRPIDPVFEDRELFADFLTSYYLRHEPDSAFVIDDAGEVKGYLLGCLHPLRNQLYNATQNLLLFGVLAVRYPRYSAASRKFIRWIFLNAWREVPAAPKRTPHFHVNLLPEMRGLTVGKALFDAFMAHLVARGVKRIFGQMVSFEGRRGEAMFRRYGFKLLNKSEITKYRDLHPEPVYLSTVVRDFEETPVAEPETIGQRR
ncbi:MAG: GNAT family acetyltransferase [Verrucomicrobia bacterium]|nr:GNAT family acetyltransferase [Verrucomicrobiota bacterium]